MKNTTSEIGKYYFNQPSFWENIPKNIYSEFRAHVTKITVKKNQPIFNENTIPKGLYIITAGMAKLYMINDAGEERIIYLLTKDDMFGYRSIAIEGRSTVFISALEDCEIELIEKEFFLHHLFRSMELNKLFMVYLGNEFRILYHKVFFFALKPVPERVALSLLIINQKFNPQNPSKNSFILSRKILANYIGITNETLSRQLKILKDLNAISTNGRKINFLDTGILYRRANI